MARLLKSRPDVQELHDKLLASVKVKLQNMPAMSNSDLACCYEHIANIDMPDQMRTNVFALLDGCAMEGVAGQSVGRLASSGQECKAFSKYLTATEITDLEGCSMWAGCAIIAKRMKLLGISGMKESLKKTILGLLVSLEQERSHKIPCADAIYKLGHHLVHTLQGVIVEVSPASLALKAYPEDPMALSDSHFLAAYPVERPALREFPQLAIIIQKHIKVRSSALAITKEHTQPQQSSAASSAQPAAATSFHPAAGFLGDQFMMHLLASFHKASATILSGSTQKGSEIEILRSPSKRQALANGTSSESLSTGQKTPAEENNFVAEQKTIPEELSLVVGNGNENDKASPTLESIEEANYAQLQERNVKAKSMKRPAACSEMSAKKKPKAKAKASGKAKAVAQASSVQRGCLRCRGNPNGCSACLKDSFSGMRMSRQEWVQHARLNNLK